MLHENIKLHRMIVHKVDFDVEQRKYQEPQLSDLESPVDNEDVNFFFRQHIANGKEHLYARSGVFDAQPKESNIVIQLVCDELLSSPEHFVSCSQQIARHLFEAMKKDRRISPGDLIVATYTDSAIGENTECLALLKMDPSDGFVSERREENGHVQIVLRRVEDVLPNSELQKCAFVLPPKARTNERHLIVLDQQITNRGGSRTVATFFISDFLQCKVDLNNREKTQVFFVGSRDFRGQKKAIWSEEQTASFDATIEAALQNLSIDVAALARIAVQEVAEQDEYIEYIRGQMRADGFEDLVFEPDQTMRNQKNYVVILGDEELKIRVEADAVGKGKTLEFTKNEATGQTEIIIMTAKFEKKEKRGKR